jgi:hypothetical protein
MGRGPRCGAIGVGESGAAAVPVGDAARAGARRVAAALVAGAAVVAGADAATGAVELPRVLVVSARERHEAAG